MNEQRVIKLRNLLGIEDNKKLIEEYDKIIESENTPNNVKSKAYYGIGEVICFLAPELSEDIGYLYFKKALEYDESNLEARIGICTIFNTYPYPMNTIVTEEECLQHISILLNCIAKLNDEKIKYNTIAVTKAYIQYRLKMI